MSDPQSQLQANSPQGGPNGDPWTLRRILDQYTIIVPKLQRDYAQGRMGTNEGHVEQVRKDFLLALHEALTSEQEAPLNLDFIYGSVQGNVFTPLDGQQRLTTLFLLHWYLAYKDGKTGDFRELCINKDNPPKSKFRYEVRQSSTEFFDGLVGFVPPNDLESQPISKLIEDQPWYFRRWKQDPTVQSALHMLDAIHEKFGEEVELYDKLVNKEKPAITFHFLALNDFGLSDDLYIKMNARGKPLTPFEAFKAGFEEELKQDKFNGMKRKLNGEEVSWADYFARNIDTRWMDLFWNLVLKWKPDNNAENDVNDDLAERVDNAIMNVVRAVILITRKSEKGADNNFFDERDAGEKPTVKDKNPTIKDLDEPLSQSSFSLYKANRWLDDSFADMFMFLLDTWSSGKEGTFVQQLPEEAKGFFDEEKELKTICCSYDKWEHKLRVRFAAYASYLKTFLRTVDKKTTENCGWLTDILDLAIKQDALGELWGLWAVLDLAVKDAFENCGWLTDILDLAVKDAFAFKEWMRVVFNLSENSDIGGPNELRLSLGGLKQMFGQMNGKGILEYLKDVNTPDWNKITGFDTAQKTEEQLKSHLLLTDSSWRDLIEEAEKHFLGQIGFLLRFSEICDEKGTLKLTAEDEEDKKEKFRGYLAKAKDMFQPGKHKLNPIPGKEADHLWERALLSLGDYMLRRTSGQPTAKEKNLYWMDIGGLFDKKIARWRYFLRYAFIKGRQGEYTEDAFNKSEILKSLWDLWDIQDRLSQQPLDLAKLLDEIIKGRLNKTLPIPLPLRPKCSYPDQDPWRLALVNTPAAIEYCTQGTIRLIEGSAGKKDMFYLLSLKSMGAKHAELFTYCLWKGELESPAKQCNALEFTYRYASNKGDVSGVELKVKGGAKFLLTYRADGHYWIASESSDSVELYTDEVKNDIDKLDACILGGW